MSRVTCHVSPVTCHMSHVNFFFYIKKTQKKIPSEKIGQSGGASRWRVCYQRGLPRLVFLGIGAMMQKLGNVECSPLYSIFLHEGFN